MEGGRGENIRRARKTARRPQRSARGGTGEASRSLTQPEEKWLLEQLSEQFSKSRSGTPDVAGSAEVQQPEVKHLGGDSRRVTVKTGSIETNSEENGPEPIVVVDRESRTLKVRSAPRSVEPEPKPAPKSFWRFG